MSNTDAKIRREQDVPWQRWQMAALDAPRRKREGGAGSTGPAQGSAAGTEATAPRAGRGQQGGSSASDQAATASPAKPPGQGAAGKVAATATAKTPAQQRQTAQASGQRKQAPAADPQQAALDAERKRAREAARKEGHAEGLKAGQAEGYAKGLEEGRKAARKELEKEVKATLKPVLNLAAHFSDALALLNDEMAKDLVELALATGRHLAGEALSANPAQVVELVRGLLHTEPPMHGKPRLWLHPQDHDLVSEYLGKELEAAGWALQPDDQVSRGGCRVTSATGELDATWESRWQALRQQVRSRRSASEQAAAAQAFLDAANGNDTAQHQPASATQTAAASNPKMKTEAHSQPQANR